MREDAREGRSEGSEADQDTGERQYVPDHQFQEGLAAPDGQQPSEGRQQTVLLGGRKLRIHQYAAAHQFQAGGDVPGKEVVDQDAWGWTGVEFATRGTEPGPEVAFSRPAATSRPPGDEGQGKSAALDVQVGVDQVGERLLPEFESSLHDQIQSARREAAVKRLPGRVPWKAR